MKITTAKKESENTKNQNMLGIRERSEKKKK